MRAGIADERQWGLGFPSDSIDMASLIGTSGDGSYQSYCRAQGLAFSPVMTDQESATSILQRWLQITNTAAVWSDGMLKFVPYGDSALTGTIFSYPSSSAYNFGTNNASQSFAESAFSTNPTGSWSYAPDVTPIYNLTDDDFIADGDDDPVQVTRIDPWTMPNYLNIEIYQRSNFYDATPITAFDKATIEAYGQRVGQQSRRMKSAIRPSRKRLCSSSCSASSIFGAATSSSSRGNIACLSPWIPLRLPICWSG
ncbi:MAG: phage tail protein [Methylovirgula sp.]